MVKRVPFSDQAFNCLGEQGRLLFEPIFLQGTNLVRPSFTDDLKEIQSSSTDLEVEIYVLFDHFHVGLEAFPVCSFVQVCRPGRLPSYAPNFEKVGDIFVSACPYVCVCVCVCVFMFEILS